MSSVTNPYVGHENPEALQVVVVSLHMAWEVGHIAICPFVCMAMHRLWERHQHRKKPQPIIDFGDAIEGFPKREFFVRSVDGTDYKIGLWAHGVWVPGTLNDAYRELALLDEPGAHVVSKAVR